MYNIERLLRELESITGDLAEDLKVKGFPFGGLIVDNIYGLVGEFLESPNKMTKKQVNHFIRDYIITESNTLMGVVERNYNLETPVISASHVMYIERIDNILSEILDECEITSKHG